MSSDSIVDGCTVILTRYTDVDVTAMPAPAVALPPVNWAAIGQTAPTLLPIGPRKSEDPLPSADIVILTWTSAEWFALDHVFLNSSNTGDFNSHEWKQAWYPFTHGASAWTADPKSGTLWGHFQMVRITDRSRRPWRVLLFKSNSHLAHPPWVGGLTAMLRYILEDTRAERIYTIGTAGGTNVGERLGDSVIANAALLDLQRSQNAASPENGDMYRCPTWFPSSALLADVERELLYPLKRIVTRPSLDDLFGQLKTKHPDDPGLSGLTLDDLLNDAMRPDCLDRPTVHVLKDTPLLTTDFYFIASGNDADAYAFLEMDDAIVGREANRLGVRFVCIRNISDPVVPDRAGDGTVISDAVRGDWSGLVYSTFGLYTSFNSAVVTWATIAGEGSPGYHPRRDQSPPAADDPLEVKLAFQVRSCGTCSFFWPDDKSRQPYGPYTAFDFDINMPYPDASGSDNTEPHRWVFGRTRPPSFPNGEIIDGCRKAPIMTIGINPNLTAFSPGQSGAAWCYPNFSSDGHSDMWTKYAWYYRYRSVYQERLTLDFVRKFVLPEGRIFAPRNGHVVSAERSTDSPEWKVSVRYDGDSEDTILTLPGVVGDFPYMLLFDHFPPNDKFAAGDLIAGRMAVPEGIRVEVMQQVQGYYLQFVPVLEKFQEMLQDAGHAGASLQIGEDVCQLDMVACASPHWRADFFGGTQESIDTIVHNCVSRNAWAIKQIVQTKPVVLYIVSKSSWEMFNAAFGAHVRRNIPISRDPADKDFTLLRETTDPSHPAYVEFDVTVDGKRYHHRMRLVITPHFSYDVFFLQQFRLCPDTWAQMEQEQAECLSAMPSHGFSIVQPDPMYPDGYTVIQLSSDHEAAKESIKWLKEQFPMASTLIESSFYDPHEMMASVLRRMYHDGDLAWVERGDGRSYLRRNEGSCRFCVNSHWQFPNECRYEKTEEDPPPPGFLERVAESILATGKPEEQIP